MVTSDMQLTCHAVRQAENWAVSNLMTTTTTYNYFRQKKHKHKYAQNNHTPKVGPKQTNAHKHNMLQFMVRSKQLATRVICKCHNNYLTSTLD